MNLIIHKVNIIKSLQQKAFKLCALAIGFMLYTFNSSAQTTAPFSYTQYMNNLTPINSAYSLLDQAGSLTGVIRKQFTGINGSPATYLVDASIPIPDVGASTGFIVQND